MMGDNRNMIRGGFSEGGTLREKRKHIDAWVSKLKAEKYQPHPFDIVGVYSPPRSAQNYPLEPKSR
jgi:hypothetical protein